MRCFCCCAHRAQSEYYYYYYIILSLYLYFEKVVTFTAAHCSVLPFVLIHAFMLYHLSPARSLTQFDLILFRCASVLRRLFVVLFKGFVRQVYIYRKASMSDSPWLASIVSFLDGSVSDGDSDSDGAGKVIPMRSLDECEPSFEVGEVDEPAPSSEPSSRGLLKSMGVTDCESLESSKRFAELKSQVEVLRAQLAKQTEFHEAEQKAADEALVDAAIEARAVLEEVDSLKNRCALLEQERDAALGASHSAQRALDEMTAAHTVELESLRLQRDASSTARDEINALKKQCGALEKERAEAAEAMRRAEKALDNAASAHDAEIKSFKLECDAARAQHECEMDAKEDAIRKLKSELEQVRFRVEVEQEEKKTAADAASGAVSALQATVREQKEKLRYQRRYMNRLKEKTARPFAVYADSNSQVAVVPAERPSALNKAKAKKIALAAHLDKENRVNIRSTSAALAGVR